MKPGAKNGEIEERIGIAIDDKMAIMTVNAGGTRSAGATGEETETIITTAIVEETSAKTKNATMSTIANEGGPAGEKTTMTPSVGGTSGESAAAVLTTEKTSGMIVTEAEVETRSVTVTVEIGAETLTIGGSVEERKSMIMTMIEMTGKGDTRTKDTASDVKVVGRLHKHFEAYGRLDQSSTVVMF